MSFIPLSASWKLSPLGGPVPDGTPQEIPATVPGTVHTDLLNAGLIADPYLDRNEDLVQWIGESDFSYSAQIDVDDEGAERTDLVFDGLDTVATVSLGDTVIGQTRNQHRRYRFDVTALVQSGERGLRVDFSSAMKEARAAEARIGWRPRVGNPNPYNALRKMACNFGWDWGPVLVTAGIDGPVSVHQWSIARLAEVVPLVTVDDGTGHVTVRVALERTGNADVLVSAVLTAPDGTEVGSTSQTTTDSSAELSFDIAGPELWWPRGYGSQPLYGLAVTLHDARTPSHELDVWRRSIGFRTVEVKVAPDDHGTSFSFSVNGKYVFVKGANWIPDDCFTPRVTEEDYARGVADAVDANMNLLRVWGGGRYESDALYDLCDRAGLMVWQDFAFACAAYSEADELWKEVEAEARENVARLAPHASLVFWNGSNENIEGFWHWGWREELHEGESWGLGYYDDLLPRVIAEIDPTRDYRPSSPFNPKDWSDVRNPNHGTVHSWVAWNQRDYLAYGESIPRFVAEFGFQGPPNWSTLTRAVHDEPLAPTSAGVLAHQKADDGNGKLERGFIDHLPSPATMDDWHFTTQINQARAITYGIEHFRSWSPRTAGTIIWQLNDCWPVASWAAVDGDGRRKPLWYALRAVHADRLLSVQPRDGALALIASNDTDAVWSETLVIERRGLNGDRLASSTVRIDVPPRTGTTMPMDADITTPGDPRSEVLVVESDDAATAWWWFVEDRELALELADLDIVVTREGDSSFVDVSARTTVKHLCLAPDRLDSNALIDSALVTLLPGQSHRFIITSDHDLDVAALTSHPVLNSVNALVSARRTAIA